jgi:hypothetical protein
MPGVRMIDPGRLLRACALVLLFAPAAASQEPPPRIPWFVVDLHGTFTKFPDEAALAASRGLQQLELPGGGFGLDGGLHLYPLRWKAVTFGIGAQVTAARSHSTPDPNASPTLGLRPVTEKFVSAAPQLSLNFGSGKGWSYISGGIGLSQWSVVPDGAEPLDADTERLRTTNYGGGARWFIRPHLAFSFDFRFYGIPAGTPTELHAASPRATLLVVGAGVSLK